MKRLFFIIAITLSITGLAQSPSYTWKQPPSVFKVFEKQPAATVLQECPTRRGCSYNQAELDAQVAAFLACMADKMDVIIDPMSINYSVMHSGGIPDLHCWCYLCRDLGGDPIYPLNMKKEITAPDKKPVTYNLLAHECFETEQAAIDAYNSRLTDEKRCHFIDEASTGLNQVHDCPHTRCTWYCYDIYGW